MVVPGAPTVSICLSFVIASSTDFAIISSIQLRNSFTFVKSEYGETVRVPFLFDSANEMIPY